MQGNSRFLRLISLTPFDNTTAAGRDVERHRRAILSILANIFSKSTGLVMLVVSVPLTVSYLGEERFGIWMTLISLAGLLSFADLGIGNALVTRVATLAANPEKKPLGIFISNSLAFLFILGLGVGGLLLLLIHVLPLELLFRGSDIGLVPEIRLAFGVMVVCFAASIPLQALQRVFAGLQSSYVGHLVNGLGTLLALGALCALADREAPIPSLILGTYAVQVASNAVLLVLLARRQLLVPVRLREVFSMASNLVRSGSLFLLLQIAAVAGWGMDNVIVAAALGASQVTTLVIVQRLFEFVVQPLGLVNAPLWAAYADAHARRDAPYIRRTLRRSLVFTAISAGALASIIVVAGPWLIAIWLHSQVPVPRSLIAIYGAWIVISSTGSALAMYLNGVGIIREQVAVAIPFAIGSALCKLMAVSLVGLSGIPAATIAVYGLIVILPYATIYRRRILEPTLAT